MTDFSAFDTRLRRIDSRQNARVKELRRAFAESSPNEQGEVAIEGMHLVEEAIRSGLRLGTVFFSESARERIHKLLPQLSSHTEALLLPDSVFASAVPTETPQGIAALVRVKPATLASILESQPALLVVAAGLQDPGNLGTIARSAEAFGVTGLLLGERTVSPWNWKALRASAGSLFRVPMARTELGRRWARSSLVTSGYWRLLRIREKRSPRSTCVARWRSSSATKAPAFRRTFWRKPTKPL